MTMPILRAMDIIPSVTTKDGIPAMAISVPLMAPTSSEAPIAAGNASVMGSPACMITVVVMAEISTVEPTDRSIPPVMITAVMPMATIATKAKLRVTLNRLLGVAKVLVSTDIASTASKAASSTQNICLLTSQDPKLRCVRCSIACCREESAFMASPYARSIAPVIRPVTSSGELSATSLSATFCPRRSTTSRSHTAKTSGIL